MARPLVAPRSNARTVESLMARRSLLSLVEVSRVLLAAFPAARADRELRPARRTDGGLVPQGCARVFAVLAQGVEVQVDGLQALQVRSEERRVGKECRSRWSPYH